MPYGFFPSPVPLPGLGDGGYPVLFDTSLTSSRMQRVFAALQQGGYLDAQLTESLTVQLVSYSPELRVFGYWRGEFRWGRAGLVEAKFSVDGLPAVTWTFSTEDGRIRLILPDLLLALLAASYFASTLYDIVRSIQEDRLRTRALRRILKVYARRGVTITDAADATTGPTTTTATAMTTITPMLQLASRSRSCLVTRGASSRSMTSVRRNQVAPGTEHTRVPGGGGSELPTGYSLWPNGGLEENKVDSQELTAAMDTPKLQSGFHHGSSSVNGCWGDDDSVGIAMTPGEEVQQDLGRTNGVGAEGEVEAKTMSADGEVEAEAVLETEAETEAEAETETETETETADEKVAEAAEEKVAEAVAMALNGQEMGAEAVQALENAIDEEIENEEYDESLAAESDCDAIGEASEYDNWQRRGQLSIRRLHNGDGASPVCEAMELPLALIGRANRHNGHDGLANHISALSVAAVNTGGMRSMRSLRGMSRTSLMSQFSFHSRLSTASSLAPSRSPSSKFLRNGTHDELQLRAASMDLRMALSAASKQRIGSPVNRQSSSAALDPNALSLKLVAEEDVVAVRSKKGIKAVRKYRARMTLFWGVYETLVCGLMAGALAVLFMYSISQEAPSQRRYDVYDSISAAPARFFMLRRSTTGLNATAIPKPGDPLRWKLPEDTSGLEGVASVYDKVQKMRNTWMLYNLLQGLVLMLLIMRLVHRLSFQPRLSIISGTLARMIPDLAGFVLVLVTILLMFAFMLVTLWGDVVKQLSTAADGVVWAFTYFITALDSSVALDVVHAIHDPNNNANGAYVFMSWVVTLCGPLFFIFTLQRFVMALLAWPFSELKLANRDEPLASKEVAQLTWWLWQRIVQQAPGNKGLMGITNKALAKIRQHRKRSRIVESVTASLESASNMRHILVNSIAAVRRPDLVYKTMQLEVAGKWLSAAELAQILASLRRPRWRQVEETAEENPPTCSRPPVLAAKPLNGWLSSHRYSLSRSKAEPAPQTGLRSEDGTEGLENWVATNLVQRMGVLQLKRIKPSNSAVGRHDDG
ncbi:hypothetical protein Vretimale_17596, partial [Volvox reticuliferus]